MIPRIRPIRLIHVSGLNGSQSLWSRGIAHASRYRFLHERLQLPSWNPDYFPQESPEMVSSVCLCGSVSTASPSLSSVVSPSIPSIRRFPQPLHRPHRTVMLSLGHARRIRSFLFLLPSPPPHTMQVALHARNFFPSVCSMSFPAPPTSPSRGVHSSLLLLLRHLPASAVNLPLHVPARHVLCFSVSLNKSLY